MHQLAHQDHELAHKCVSSYEHLPIHALLIYTRESVARAIVNLSVCAPLSVQFPAWAKWERASVGGARTYGRRSSIYMRTIIVRWLNNSWPLRVASRRLLMILMSHQKVTEKDVADNHFWGRPIMPEVPKNWMRSSMDTYWRHINSRKASRCIPQPPIDTTAADHLPPFNFLEKLWRWFSVMRWFFSTCVHISLCKVYLNI